MVEVGKIYTSTNYGKFKVVRAEAGGYYLIKFVKTGYKFSARRQKILLGKVKDPYHPKICGVGYLGVGPYTAGTHGKHTWTYALWLRMLQRCYDPKVQNRYPAYIGVTVCSRWHCYQDFCVDVTKMKNAGTKGFDFDKDALGFGKNIYSPDTCTFLPASLNRFMSSLACPADSLIIRNKNDYSVRGFKEGKLVRIASKIPTLKQAHAISRLHKIAQFTDLLNKYKHQLAPKVVTALRTGFGK